MPRLSSYAEVPGHFFICILLPLSRHKATVSVISVLTSRGGGEPSTKYEIMRRCHVFIVIMGINFEMYVKALNIAIVVDVIVVSLTTCDSFSPKFSYQKCTTTTTIRHVLQYVVSDFFIFVTTIESLSASPSLWHLLSFGSFTEAKRYLAFARYVHRESRNTPRSGRKKNAIHFHSKCVQRFSLCVI